MPCASGVQYSMDLLASSLISIMLKTANGYLVLDSSGKTHNKRAQVTLWRVILIDYSMHFLAICKLRKSITNSSMLSVSIPIPDPWICMNHEPIARFPDSSEGCLSPKSRR